MSKTLDKVSKARAGLVLDHPFFGSLALRQKLVEDPTCDTAWTDGKTMGFSPSFVDKLPLDQLKGVLAHECLHVGNAHHARRGARDHRKWNQACDYAINKLLVDCGFSLPSGALLGMDGSAESIYARMPDPPKGGNGGKGKGKGPQGGNPGKPGQGDPDDQPGTDPGGCGEVRDAPGKDGGKANQVDMAQAEAEAKVATSQAAAVARACGKLPGALKGFVEELLEPQVDWRTELRRFLAQASKNDYTWKRPNSRYLAGGFYLPSLYSEELPPLVVAVDTSGSVSDTELVQFASEISAIRSEGGASRIDVVYVDTQVQGHQSFEAEDEIKIKYAGRGGTRFTPAFDWADQQEEIPSAFIYLTDGEAYDFPPSPPEYPVLWIIIGQNRSFAPPFGEVIKMTPQ